MKNKFFLLLILLAAGIAPTARAGDDAVPAGPETVIVPFDVTKPIDSQKLDQLYVPYERFLELWAAAKANKRGHPPEQMEQHYVLSSARYDAKLDDGALHVTGVIDLQTFNDDWVSVPLAFKDVKLGVLKLDGQTAPLAADGLAINKAGHHRIDVEFDFPVGNDKSRLTWGIPQTAGTLFSITLPDKQMKASVQPGSGAVERINGDQKIVTAALGSTDHVELLLDSSVGLSTITQAAVAKIETNMSITPAVELLHTGFEFLFPESQQDHFTVSLDKALALVNLDVPNIKSWKLTVGNDSQSLEITLAEPVRDSFKFSIDAERTLTDQQRRFPFISAAAHRIEQTTALFSTPFLDVTPQPTAALRQISYSGQTPAGLRLVAAYASTGDRELLAYGVQPAKLSNKAEISYVYLVNHSKIELVAALKLRMKNATLFDLTVGLPGDFEVQAVESGRLKDWWREGDVLHVRFKGNAPDAETPLVVHLVKLFKTVPDALEIKPLTLADSWDVEGNGIIAASSAVDASMTLAEAKEINPQNAATDFRILPPMERKLGFSFKGQNFHASVKLATLPPRVIGTWVMSALAHESWVSVSTHVSLSARQGSAPGATFRLPASTPEARVTGDNVRETTSAVEGNWRVYRVAFQNDLTDQTGFTVDFDLPGTGNVSLPSFEFLDVERSEGFVIVDNASEYEMQVVPSGLEAALSSQIPFLPEVSRNASLYRALKGWTLQISLARLEKEAGRSALVEYAELSTAIRADGTEWYRATYHLQNRSLQFLPVKLPEGSELASVTVKDESVRADSGQVGGKNVLLVPLIKTNPWDTSYDVNIVYRKKGRSLWTFNHEKLADPEVVGITVERTIWHLYVPEGTEAGQFGGNMEQVQEETGETEKQEGTFEEMTKLESVALNPNNPADVQAKAAENVRMLSDTLEENSKAPNKIVDNDALVYQKQSAEAAQKKMEIQKEVADEKKNFEGNYARAQQGNVDGLRRVPNGQPGAEQGKNVVLGSNQSWATNSAFIAAPEAKTVEKSKEIDRATPQGNQLYVNDYVVNVQKPEVITGGNGYGGATTLNGANTFNVSAGTTIVSGTLSNGTVASAITNGAGTLTFGGNNTYSGATTLNGGVVLANSGTLVQNQVSQIQSQQEAERHAKAEPPAQRQVSGATSFPFSNILGGGQVTTGLRSGGEALGGIPAGNPTAVDAFSGSVNYGSPIQQNGNNAAVLDAARANAEINAPVYQTQLRQLAKRNEQAEAQQALQAAPAAAAAPAGDLIHGEEEKEEAAVGGGAGAGFATTYYSRGILQGPQGPAQLQPAGAISLPVDFPTDGLHVYHFKKLKANATLTFWITNGESLDKWKWLAVFLLAAAVTKAIFVAIDRGYLRIMRRRIVHI